MTRRAMMDDRPSSRGTPTGTPMPGTPMPGTPPSSLSAQSPSAAPSPARQDTPAPPQQAPTPPLMLATMTPVNVDGYMYEHHQTSEHHHLPHPHQPPVIYSTASLTDHQGLPVPVGVSDDGLMDGTGVVVYQQQVPQNTVLVLSELVDDMSPVLQLRTRRKDVDGSPGDPDVDGHPASGGEVDGGQWRSSLEHPLTAATSAMLNINSGPEDPANPSSNGSNPPPMSFAVYDYKTDKLGELWSSASTAGGPGGGVLQLKAANGASGAGLGGATLDGDLHGLFLQPHHQQQQLLVKREPEDLSHRKQQSSPGLAGGRSSSNGSSSSGSAKLVLANGGAGAEHGDGLDVIKDEYKAMAYSTQMFGGQPAPQGHHGSGTPSPGPYNDMQYAAAPPPGPQQPVYMSPVPNLRTSAPPPTSSSFATVPERYYSDYFPPVPDQGYATLRQQIPTYMDPAGEAAGGPTVSTSDLVRSYVRTSAYNHNKGVIAAATAAGLTVDLPSPDSGIGAEAITPRDQTAIQQSFDYTDLCSSQGVMDPLTVRASSQGVPSPGAQSAAGQPPPARSRPWHDFGRQNDADKIQIQKLYTNYGFKYTLETPISTSQRREDDRVTYINKGQFYGITMEYIPDPETPMLKNHTVKSVVMLMFREEKSPEDEIKAWQFWHGRQHSVKQRILDADTKNSMGLVGCIEELSHNAIAVYWNPLESPAKINVAVQCLSTDFSSQKGVKGLPLHIQIDTYEDPRDGPVYHRGYCQIKVFCDKGAERKTRDEERRAAKRKMTATGRKKLDELYHPAAERTDFYHMADLHKPPVLFSPSEELTSMELQGFYGHDTDNSSVSNGEGGLKSATGGGSPFLLHSTKPLAHQTLKFHNHFPPDAPGIKKEHSMETEPLSTDGGLFSSPALKRPRLLGPPGTPLGMGSPGAPQLHHGLGPAPGHAPSHAPLMGHPGHPATPPLAERVMLYVRQDPEDVYTPLHVVPPTAQGLLNAIENKYKISPSSISNLYRKNKKGITVKIDDEMVKHYCNEDLFIMEIKQDSHTDEEELYEVTLIELPNP